MSLKDNHDAIIYNPVASNIPKFWPSQLKVILVLFNSILYFNVLTQQQQEPITESAQENNKCTKIRAKKLSSKETLFFLNVQKSTNLI
jgi:hypothetical protein